MYLALKLVVSALALGITAYIVPGFEVDSIVSAVVAALVLGIVNTLIKPLMLLITLPLNIVTLGLFTFVINALMLVLTASIVPGFGITGFLPAIAGAIVLMVVSAVLESFSHTQD
jgi:putative membrane protein